MKNISFDKRKMADCFKLTYSPILWAINEEKNTIVAKIFINEYGEVKELYGKATCLPEDDFNLEKGKQIALAKLVRKIEIHTLKILKQQMRKSLTELVENSKMLDTITEAVRKNGFSLVDELIEPTQILEDFYEIFKKNAELITKKRKDYTKD